MKFFKSAPPRPASGAFCPSELEKAAEDSITLFITPPGFLLTEILAAALAKHRRQTLWLRLGPEDGDPATFLLSCVTALEHLCPGASSNTLAQMRREPGPVAGWGSLFGHLGKQLREGLGSSSALVLENIHHLQDKRLTLGLLGHYLLPEFISDGACVLTAYCPLPLDVFPPRILLRYARDLQVNVPTALALAGHEGVEITSEWMRRAVSLIGGRAVVLQGLFAASTRLGLDFVKTVVENAKSDDDILIRIARAWLATAGPEALEALALAWQLEYSHPDLVRDVLGYQDLTADPWLQPLLEQCTRLRQVWRNTLRTALPARAHLSPQTLRRTATYLAAQGQIQQAVPLYLQLGELDRAAQVIADASEQLLDLGQWETLRGWIERLPPEVIQGHPRLVYSQAEMAASQGKPGEARRTFAVASELFVASQDPAGACQSLLAESTLAERAGDHTHAQQHAQAAYGLAEANGLLWFRFWAAWHQSAFASAHGEWGDLLHALSHATAAAASMQDPAISELLSQAEYLSKQRLDFLRQREYYRQAYWETKSAENEAAERLCRLLVDPGKNLASLVVTRGWSDTPLMARLTAVPKESPILNDPIYTRIFNSLLSALGLYRPTKPRVPETVELDPSIKEPRLVLPSDTQYSLTPTTLTLPPEPDANASNLIIPSIPASDSAVTEGTASSPAVADVTAIATGPVQSGTSPSLTAYLLGGFRIAVNLNPVENWPSNRGRMVLKYLLTHRDRPVPREVLMETFWPNAKPGSARNRLNVALHGLRQSLRAAADVPVVLYQGEAYGLNPELGLWVDVDEFERHVQCGRRLEVEGRSDAAMSEYALATGLYQGDFLADDVYEDWAVLTRERLRDQYLDAVYRFSQIQFGQGQYAACATLCQLILSRDSCREDAHRCLMRCYSRQGQLHLALRQYQVCAEELRRELDVAPAGATSQLSERIRKHESI